MEFQMETIEQQHLPKVYKHNEKINKSHDSSEINKTNTNEHNKLNQRTTHSSSQHWSVRNGAVGD
jgi:hypothetical protein